MVNREIHVIFSCKGRNGLDICCGEQLTDENDTGEQKDSFGMSGF